MEGEQVEGQNGNEEPKGQQAEPASGSGAKGTPDLKAENTRLNDELKAANSRADDLQKQLESLNESVANALTQDDVETAVKEAQAKAEAAHEESKAAWEAERKKLSVENALISAGCTDVIGCIAHLDMGKVQVAPDGHISGLDTKALAKEHPHLFAEGGNTATVASAAAPGGAAKTMTREEIMAEKDPAKRRKLIGEHMDLFE